MYIYTHIYICVHTNMYICIIYMLFRLLFLGWRCTAALEKARESHVARESQHTVLYVGIVAWREAVNRDKLLLLTHSLQRLRYAVT